MVLGFQQGLSAQRRIPQLPSLPLRRPNTCTGSCTVPGGRFSIRCRSPGREHEALGDEERAGLTPYIGRENHPFLGLAQGMTCTASVSRSATSFVSASSNRGSYQPSRRRNASTAASAEVFRDKS